MNPYIKTSILLPLVVVLSIRLNAGTVDFHIDISRIIERKSEIARRTLIYTITTGGYNIECVERSSASVIYWTDRVKRDYGLTFESELWVVTEEDAYRSHRERYEEIQKHGARIIVVPKEYRTKNDTPFKARALNYAKEMRKKAGLHTEFDWVYHQDEETMIGEDTVLGNLDFISNDHDTTVYGAGIILYPQDWRNSMTCAEELARSADDYRILYPIKILKSNLFGYHGSHFLCRSDVEDRIGWDFGQTKAEDWLFALGLMELNREGQPTNRQAINSRETTSQLQKTYPAIMKGFAYEKAAFTFGDMLKQRRRWILGAVEIVRRRNVSLKYRIAALAGLLAWMSAAPSILAAGANLVHPTGGLFLGSGILAGFVWYSIFEEYRTGYELNRHYFPRRSPKSWMSYGRLFLNFLQGLFADAIAPWYAILRRTKTYDCIRKDAKSTIKPGRHAEANPG